MEYQKLKEIIKDMQDSNLNALEIEFPDGTRINMEKGNNSNINHEIKPIINNKEEEKIEEGKFIKSPMVGTFYIKPAPTSEPFVEIGQNVKKGNIVCIIEAMKLMNEIESEFNGTIEEILVKDGEPVDYGKPLFRISERK